MSSNSLIDKLKKNSTSKLTTILTESKVFGKKDMIVTNVPILNMALSGDFDGGLAPGILQISGPSKHFKTAFGLTIAAAFQRKYPDGVILFYDSEFGAPQDYFDSFGVDMDRVVYTPITDVEALKFDLVNQLTSIEKGEHVMVLIDSIGNLASKKEVEDALDEKSVADMTRAKALKSLFRIITPHLNLKDIPMVAINHTYKEIGLYPKDVVSGGTGAYYSSNDIWIVGRQQEKDGADVIGFNFIINIEKSRFVKEKSKFPVTVTFERGIEYSSGLFDLAMDFGFITSGKQGWYLTKNSETQRRKSDIENDVSYWKALLSNKEFLSAASTKYKLPLNQRMETGNDNDTE